MIVGRDELGAVVDAQPRRVLFAHAGAPHFKPADLDGGGAQRADEFLVRPGHVATGDAPAFVGVSAQRNEVILLHQPVIDNGTVARGVDMFQRRAHLSIHEYRAVARHADACIAQKIRRRNYAHGHEDHIAGEVSLTGAHDALAAGIGNFLHTAAHAHAHAVFLQLLRRQLGKLRLKGGEQARPSLDERDILA